MHKAPKFTPEEMKACADAIANAFRLLMMAAEAACKAFQAAMAKENAGEWWKDGQEPPEYCHRPDKPEWETDDPEPPGSSMSA